MQRPSDRLFFATFPSPSAAEACRLRALVLQERHGLIARPIPVDRLHVTLSFLGDYQGVPDELVAKLSRCAEQVRSAPFRVTFDRVRSFSPSRACAFLPGRGADHLATLHASLQAAFLNHGLSFSEDAHYAPHLTLLYDPKLLSEQFVEPVSWVIEDFALVHSLVGRGTYQVLQRFRFAG